MMRNRVIMTYNSHEKWLKLLLDETKEKDRSSWSVPGIFRIYFMKIFKLVISPRDPHWAPTLLEFYAV